MGADPSIYIVCFLIYNQAHRCDPRPIDLSHLAQRSRRVGMASGFSRPDLSVSSDPGSSQFLNFLGHNPLTVNP
jgi:hypothetical protein